MQNLFAINPNLKARGSDLGDCGRLQDASQRVHLS